MMAGELVNDPLERRAAWHIDKAQDLLNVAHDQEKRPAPAGRWGQGMYVVSDAERRDAVAAATAHATTAQAMLAYLNREDAKGLTPHQRQERWSSRHVQPGRMTDTHPEVLADLITAQERAAKEAESHGMTVDRGTHPWQAWHPEDRPGSLVYIHQDGTILRPGP